MALVTGITDAVGLTDSAGTEALMKKSEGMSQAALDYIKGLDIPDEEKQRIMLEAPELVEQLVAEELGPSAFEDIQLDPRLAGVQMEALQALQERSEKGLTQADKYDIEEALDMASGREMAARRGIEQEMQRKGMGDSGQALMMKLQAQQGAANQGRRQSMDLARQALQQKADATSRAGQMAGQMQQADFARQAQGASAKDIIAARNAANRQQAQWQNVAARQNIENQRAALANQQQMYNKQLAQQTWQNQLQKAGLMSGQYQNMANVYGQQAGAKAGADAATMSTLGNLGAAYMGMPAQDGGIMRAQDGGVAQKAQQDSMKQHEAFKKKYMKKVQDELLGESKAAQAAHKEVVRAQDGAVMPMVTKPSELRPEGGTDFAGPENRQSAIIAALLSEIMNADPEQNIPMRRGLPEYACGGVHKAQDGNTMYASDGLGGIIDSGMESYADDRVDAKVNDGEMILNLPQQQRLMDMIRGEISPDELGTDDIVEGVPREYSEELHESEEEDSEVAGLKKLLKALGRS